MISLNPIANKNRSLISVIIIGILAITCLINYKALILTQGPPTWDGADHSLNGLNI